MKRFDSEQLKTILSLIKPDEERKVFLEADDPVLWAENHLYHPDNGDVPLEVKTMFHELLRDPRRDRASRIGRQAGKTVHMTIDIMHTAVNETKAVILVFIPEKKNMNRMLEIMRNFLRKSDQRSSFSMGRKDRRRPKGEIRPEYDYEISVSSGSVIRFFFMSHNPDKIRGQRGTHIYMDEVDYFPKKAFDAILGILKGNPKITIWASSTPSGVEGTWFKKFCVKCRNPENPDGAEYHIPSTMEENWAEIEERLRAGIFDEVTWKLEVLAEFAEARGAVYKKEAIDQAVQRSFMNNTSLKAEEIYQTLEYKTAPKFLGVDWNNPQNGVRLVEIAEMYGAPWVVRNEKISYEVYTQTAAVERIIQLFRKHRYKIISVDSGYGATQIELLHRDLVDLKVEPKKILNVVESRKQEEMVIKYTSPLSGSRRQDIVRVTVRHQLVGLLGQYLEDNLVLLKEEDDGESGLVVEVRNFRRKKSNTMSTGFEYGDDTHSVSALQFCLNGYVKYLATEQRDPRATLDSIRTAMIQEVIQARKERTPTPPPILRSAFAGRALHSRTRGLHGRSSRHPI